MVRILPSLAIASLFCTACALDIQGKIQWTELCPGPRELGSAKVLLDNGRLSAGVMHDGSFLIPDVPVGTYVLSVLARDQSFDQLRIDVVEDSPIPVVRPFVVGTPLDPPAPIPLPYPVKLVARQKHDYFVPRESFNIIAMFQNPMMLIMVFGAVMVMATPYIMKNIDPELMQEVQNRRSQTHGRNHEETRTGHAMVANESASSDVTNGLQPSRSRGGKNKRR